MRITKHFEMRVGELSAQRGEDRQGENEISDGTAADDEDFAFAQTISPKQRSTASLEVYMARNAVKPRTTTSNAKARRMEFPTLMRCSLAVFQFRKSRKRQGEMVNQIPATTIR